MASSTGSSSTTPKANNSTNDLMIKYLGRDLLSEIPACEYFRIPKSLLFHTHIRAQTPSNDVLPGPRPSLLSLPTEIMVIIYKSLSLETRTELARTCKHLAGIAVSHAMFRVQRGLPDPPCRSRRQRGPLLFTASGGARCGYCHWQGQAFDLFFSRHRKLEMLRQGQTWTRGSMAAYGYKNIFQIYNMGMGDTAARALPDSRQYRRLVTRLRNHGARFDEMVKLVRQNTN